MWANVSRSIRALRHRRGWPQHALGARTGLSRETVSRIERGEIAGVTLGTLIGIVDALGATIHVQVRWRGELLDRLVDAAHAALQETVAAWLTTAEWQVRAEVSFNHYGDRGRVDLLAYHSVLRILVVAEVKSALGDLQDTLGRLDVKVRLARQLARDAGWTDVAAVIPALVIGDSRAARRIVGAHATLFARFDVRGRRAMAWLRRPVAPNPTGLLWYLSRPNSRGATTRNVGSAMRRPNSHGATTRNDGDAPGRPYSRPP